MIESEPPAVAPVTVAEAKAWLRIEHAEEDALIAGAVRTATELCEAFLSRALIARVVKETIPAGPGWTRLAVTPARAVTAVERVAADGTVSALPTGAAASEIDANGDGWVRGGPSTSLRMSGDPGERILVTYSAGLAADWNGVPEALRQGIVRLTAHLYATRDGAGDEGPPAAVAALWRPWRRMRL